MASSVPAGVTATITFAADGTYAVETGCNSGNGTYQQIDAARLRPSEVLQTLVECRGPAGDVERAMVNGFTAS